MAKIVFMGTPDFALPSLNALTQTHDVIAVVTQPDRPAGRKRKLRLSPVKQMAVEKGIAVLQPKRIRDAEAIEALSRVKADMFVVVAFGQILPKHVLDMPRLASLNVHASLLPRWRGAAPIQAAILAGDEQTGVTIMAMDAGLDTGPILEQYPILLDKRETGQSLHDKLARLGAEALVDILPGFLGGTITPRAQDDSLATYAPSIKKEQGTIDWAQPAIEIDRKVRAFTPWPGSFTSWKGKQLKIHAGFAATGSATPGLVTWQSGAIAIGTGSGIYCPTELQLEGKKRQSVVDFRNGYSGYVGSVLGE